MILRTSTVEDEQRILAWNAADVHFLAPLDQARLTYLKACAQAVEIIELDGVAAGFAITFIEGSSYDGEHYAWFSARYPRFHYVDRIVIDARFRGRGLARQVYAGLVARFPDRPLLAEVNYAPPNLASLAFHHRVGFEEVGRRGDQSYGVALLAKVPQRLPAD